MEHWHFIGIGGAGMSVLAHALRDQGATVSGSDLQESAALDELRARGVRVTVGHRADNPDLAHTTRVVVTAAVPPDNPELEAAQARGLAVLKRAAVLGRLMEGRTGIAVAGTHGKTTTTAMIAFILREAGRDPAFLVGGVPRDLGTGGYWGAGPELVVEADEYDRSFWHLRPQIAVITNIEAEHLDIYGDLAGVQAGFRRFAENLQPGGTLFCCGDDPGALALAEEIEPVPGALLGWPSPLFPRPSAVELAAKLQSGDPRVVLYGTRWEGAWQAEDQGQTEDGGSAFAAYYRGELLARVTLRLPGTHNILNGLAALAASMRAGVSPEVAVDALGRFSGTGRRFERKGEAGGVLVVDDYAHHPTEIAATLAAARRHYPDRRLVVAFQPHTYSRTKAFLPDFVRALAAADLVIVTEIYASRETDTLGVSGADIVALMDKAAASTAYFAPDLAATTDWLLAHLRPGDLLLTLGAGDIGKVADGVLKGLSFEC